MLPPTPQSLPPNNNGSTNVFQFGGNNGLIYRNNEQQKSSAFNQVSPQQQINENSPNSTDTMQGM